MINQSRFTLLSVFIALLLIHVLLGVFYTGYSWMAVVYVVIAYLVILLVSTYFPTWNIYMKAQKKIPLLRVRLNEKGHLGIVQNRKKIALCFDSSMGDYTEYILDILDDHAIKAAFFISGRTIENKEYLLKRMQHNGHIIGNALYNKPQNAKWKSIDFYREELEKTNQAIEAAIGKITSYFMAPLGYTNPFMAKSVATIGLKPVAFSIQGKSRHNQNELDVMNKIEKSLKSNAIILLKDDEISAKILPQLIKNINEKGFEISLFNGDV